MIKNLKMFLIGVVLLLTPFLGFPLFWKFAIVFLLALVIIFYSIEIRISIDSFRLKNQSDFIAQDTLLIKSGLKEDDPSEKPKEKKSRKKKEKAEVSESILPSDDLIKEESVSELESNAIDTLEPAVAEDQQQVI
jgi:hypothetical protein